MQTGSLGVRKSLSNCIRCAAAETVISSPGSGPVFPQDCNPAADWAWTLLAQILHRHSTATGSGGGSSAAAAAAALRKLGVEGARTHAHRAPFEEIWVRF